jgi:predicted nuclease of restriction endonuclease-like (RecB) superfamily
LKKLRHKKRGGRLENPFASKRKFILNETSVKASFVVRRPFHLEFLNVVHLANLGGSYYLEQKQKGGLDDIQ